MKNPWLIAIVNLLSVIIVLFVNYASQVQLWGAPAIGSISNEFSNLITPASYAFAIWGPIFLGLLAFCIYSFYRLFRYGTEQAFILQSMPWFVLANACNALWVYCFTLRLYGLSVLLMLILLISLLQLVRKFDMETWDAPIGTIAFIWWPISLYAGWVAVATVVNIGLYLESLGWSGAPLNPTAWTIIMLVIVTILNAYLIQKRNLREFAGVAVWALVAIGFRHIEAIPVIAYVAWTGAGLLGLLILRHGFINRSTNPFEKLRQRLSGKSQA